MKYTTYLFDFDGTLVDSMPSYIAVMLRILDENNIKYEKDIIKVITPLGYAGTARYYVEKLGLKMPEQDIVDLMNKYAYEEYANRIKAKPEVEETLRALKKQGGKLYVLTASPHTVLDVCLKRLGLFDLFDEVWSCDDFCTSKSDPEIYKMAAQRMGRPIGEILFVDDNYNADKTARMAGMRVSGIYDDSSREYTNEIKAITDHYVERFGELLEL